MCRLAKRDLKGGIVQISEVVDCAQSRPVNVGERRLVIAGIEATCVDGVGGSACRRVPVEHGAQGPKVRKQRMGEGGPRGPTPTPALRSSPPPGGANIRCTFQWDPGSTRADCST